MVTARAGGGFGDQDGMVLPGNLCVLGRAFNGEAGGQVIGDLIGDLFAIVHIDGFQALFLIDEGMAAASLKEEAGKQQALGGCGAESALDLDDGHAG